VFVEHQLKLTFSLSWHPFPSGNHHIEAVASADTLTGVILPPNEGVLRRSDQIDKVLSREAEIYPPPNVISFAQHEFGIAKFAGRVGASENRL
jgi:hypothetical protein